MNKKTTKKTTLDKSFGKVVELGFMGSSAGSNAMIDGVPLDMEVVSLNRSWPFFDMKNMDIVITASNDQVTQVAEFRCNGEPKLAVTNAFFGMVTFFSLETTPNRQPK